MRDMKSFGKLIYSRRKQVGLTQEAFAAKLGITPQAVSKWENGVGYPDVTLFPLIAETLDITIASLFGDATDKTLRFPEIYQGLSFVISIGNRACYSSKKIDRIDSEKGFVYFIDGSHADFSQGIVYNKGEGEVLFFEVEESIDILTKDSPTKLEEKLCPFRALVVSVDASCAVKVVSGEGDEPYIKANGTREFIAALRFESKDGTLTVNPKKFKNYSGDIEDNQILISAGFAKGEKLKVSINGCGKCDIEPSFDDTHFSVNGSGDIKGENSRFFRSTVNGSGCIKFKRSSADTSVSVNGSGDITLIEAAEAKITINGSGNVVTKASSNAKVHISGSGDIDLGELGGSLEMKIHGSGAIKARGEIEKLYCKITGSGDLMAKELTVTDAEIHTSSSAKLHIGHIKGVSVERLGKGTKLYVGKRGMDK